MAKFRKQWVRNIQAKTPRWHISLGSWSESTLGPNLHPKSSYGFVLLTLVDLNSIDNNIYSLVPQNFQFFQEYLVRFFNFDPHCQPDTSKWFDTLIRCVHWPTGFDKLQENLFVNSSLRIQVNSVEPWAEIGILICIQGQVEQQFAGELGSPFCSDLELFKFRHESDDEPKLNRT
jgi:hypothetical protein